jgi:hypothetical protein
MPLTGSHVNSAPLAMPVLNIFFMLSAFRHARPSVRLVDVQCHYPGILSKA